MQSNGPSHPDAPLDARNGLPHDPREAAGYYLERGWLPIPLPYRSKDPHRKGWQQLRPTAADLDGLFPPQQPRNVGLLLGEPSGGLIDVDLDVDEAVAAAPFLLPPTGWVSGRAGRPRSHFWYRVSHPPVKATQKYLDLDRTDLLELRSTGGQTVVAPSVHEASGEPLLWHAFDQPASVPLADLRSAVESLAAATLLARHWPNKGARHDARLALAGALLRARWTQTRATAFLEAVAAAAHNCPGDDCARVVADTAETLAADERACGWPKLQQLLGANGPSVVRQARVWLGMPVAPSGMSAPKQVRLLPPYQPFPVDALPAPVAEYVRQSALALGCDPAYLALPALAVTASAIGNTRTLRLKRGWEEPLVIWSAIVGDSGTLKSPAYLKAVSRLFALQKQLVDEYRVAREQHDADLHTWEAEKRKKDGEPGPKPEEPLLRRVVCSDTTIEKLAEILEDNPRGTLVARDELAGWLGSFTRYKGKQGGTDLPNWLEMFRAGTVIVDRKTGDRPTLFISRAAVSVTGGIQPGVLARALTADFLDAGLAARLLMALPPKQPKRWSEVEVDPDVEQAFVTALERLLVLDFDRRDQEPIPHVLHLTPEAKEMWVGFYNAWGREQAAAEGEVAAAFSKLEGYAARFALLHHVVTHVGLDADDHRPVGLRSVQAGIALARWFAAEARRIYAMLAESDDERTARRLVEFIQARGGRVTVRQLQKSNHRKYPDRAAAEVALQELVDGGLGQWREEAAPASQGGHPVRWLVLVQTSDTSDTRSADADDAANDASDTWPDPLRDGLPDPPASSGATASSDSSNDVFGVVDPERVSEVSDVCDREFPTDGGGDGSEPAVSSGAVAERVSDGPARDPSPFAGRARGASRTAEPGYCLVRDTSGLHAVSGALAEGGTVGLDTETTGLDPHRDSVRLLSLNVATVDGGRFTFLVDCFAVDPTPLFPLLCECEVVGHNLQFDLSMLWPLGYRHVGPLFDTMHVSRVLEAGRKGVGHTLEALAERHLGLRLDKALQKSDWSGVLTEEMLRYAARDTAAVVELHPLLRQRLTEAKLEGTAALEHRCLPGMVWLGMAGVPLDREAWTALADVGKVERDGLRDELDVLAPPRQAALPGMDAWDWGSAKQVLTLLHDLGFPVEDTTDETLAGIDHPLVQKLRDYKSAAWLAANYGHGFLRYLGPDGRIYAHWNQTGNEAGRTSCKEPNLQQIPRDPRFRKCFVAPPGRVLVKADFAAAHLRIAAKVAGEAKMIEAFRAGQDLHALTARSLLGKSEVTKQDRQLAKAVAFGLLYGMGARGLRVYAKQSYGVEMALAEAQGHKRKFFQTYPGLAAWHRRTAAGKSKQTETRTLAGRRRLLDPRTPLMHRLNSPVLGTEGDAAKAALALLWERREQVPGGTPVLFVHDEIVVECAADQAEAAAAWVKQAMLDGLAPLVDPVPVEVEVQVARTWGGE